MQPIDVGDLVLDDTKPSRQSALFHGIREKIIAGLWPKEGKLPSTRKLAMELGLSRNTIILAYEQLVSEGYINSVKGSGFFVCLELPEHYLTSSETVAKPASVAINEECLNKAFAPGVPDLSLFPFSTWQRFLQRHSNRISLAGSRSIQGDMNLRAALSDYLSSCRSVQCNPDRIVITSGAQQALTIALMATLQAQDDILMEDPGYSQMRKSIDLLTLNLKPLPIHEGVGPRIDDILSSNAKAVYLTPSNQYPMGTTLTTEQRLKLIDWAHSKQRWIIEDDYDSEFQFAHRPYTSMQGLAGKVGQDDRVLYVGSFSKVMFNGLRLGYLVLPEQLVERCIAIKDALSGDSPSHTQAALADFIVEGDLLRHIRKMRRVYKEKHLAMTHAISAEFGDRVQVISQAAGLHVTLKWVIGPSEDEWCERAKEAGIIVRPFHFYESGLGSEREWQGAVLGFGNVGLNDIDSLINKLASVF
ncbi:PLP-dependent aminotransferase family protein [Vibrio sp. T187]|uniref:MocR-like pyridoxine biosynthesis transcription factor PdxR n=1 Tax=Vibrio TaxID=662 RepID=UPI0010C9E5DD|nr:MULTISPECIES: PLP-dependent aminotransferase family protein [Vibrio]MBW3695945.1 PLP-dependent aminotransferase family protein [Vibrio sp. T187]